MQSCQLSEADVDSRRPVVPSMLVEMLQYCIYPASIVQQWCPVGLVEDGQQAVLVCEGHRHEKRCENKVGKIVLLM
jgi:hypothetical protein